MASFSVLSRIKALKRDLIEKGADENDLALVMSLRSYRLLHRACQKLAGTEIAVLEQFEDMEIIVHEKCPDDQMAIINRRFWRS